jgi:hypothetical protein
MMVLHQLLLLRRRNKRLRLAKGTISNKPIHVKCIKDNSDSVVRKKQSKDKSASGPDSVIRKKQSKDKSAAGSSEGALGIKDRR